MSESMLPYRPSLPLWAKISLFGVLLFAAWAAWLTYVIHRPATDLARRGSMITKLESIERSLRDIEQASSSMPPASLLGTEAAMKQWAAHFLRYRLPVNELLADSSEPSYGEIKDHMLAAYALENRAEQIRKDIIRNQLSTEQAKSQEAEFRANINLAVAEVKAAALQLRQPSDESTSFRRTAMTLFLLGALLVACGLVALLLIQPARENERLRLSQSLNVTQRSLQECESRSQSVFYAIPDGVVLMDEKGYVQQFSPSAERIFGTSSVDITGQSVLKLIPGTDRVKFDEHVRKLSPSREPAELAVVGRRPDGAEVPLDLILRKSTEGRMLIGVFRTKSEHPEERPAADENLRRDIGFLASILDAARSFLVILDRQGRILRCNRACEILAGRASTELRGQHFAEIFAPRREDAVRASYQGVEEGQIPDKLEEVCPSSLGDRIVSWTNAVLRDAAGKPEFLVVTGTDVTELRRQASSKPAEKAELPRLAGELGFNLGNLLTNVSGFADLVLSSLEPSHPVYQDVEQIKDSGDRAAALVRKLLAFSGRQSSRPKVIDLNGAVSLAARQQADRLGLDIELQMELHPQSPQVLADGSQLSEILGALFDNAREATPGSGAVAVRTGFSQGDAESQFATLAVADSGRGLRKEDSARIFEPFFTTKEPGKGAGMSLAAVRGIVQQFGGSVRAYGEPGKGTTIEILLPLAKTKNGPMLVEKTGTRR